MGRQFRAKGDHICLPGVQPAGKRAADCGTMGALRTLKKLDALIFDFDGVVVDNEPVHLRCFQQVLQPLGVELTRADYYARYLGYDDHDCFATVLRDQGRDYTEALLAELTERKTLAIKRAYAESVQPQPGAVELIRSAAAAGLPLAVCSGALRDEIDLAARTVGVADCFRLIVSAADVARGKPDPEGYRLALNRLTGACGRTLAAGRCVVVEDAPAGIQAAKGAGMNVLAVTTSYPAADLAAADRIVNSLADVSLQTLEELIRQ